MSKLVYLSFGKDEDLQEDCCLITFLGIDNYLRSYLYMYDDWKQVSPLMLGFVNLKNIVKNSNEKLFKIIQKKENAELPCNKIKTWLSYMPASSNFIELIKKECDYILPLFT